MKLKTLGLSLGATSTIVAPITTLMACDNNQPKPRRTDEHTTSSTDTKGGQSTSDTNKDQTTDTNGTDTQTQQSATTTTIKLSDKEKQILADAKPYTVESMRDEAKEIGWNGQFWKGGMLKESFNQIVNFAINLAMKYGFDPYANQDINNDNSNFAFVVSDKDVANKTVDEIVAEYMSNPNFDATWGTSKNDMKDLITAFAGVKPISGAVTESQKTISNMFNGDRTFKDGADTERANLEKNDLTKKLFWPEPLAKTMSGTGKGFITAQFYDNLDSNKNLVAVISGYGNGGDMTISRVVKSPDLLVPYPKIETKLFHDKYAIFMVDAIEQLVTNLGIFISELNKFHASPIVINALSHLKDKVLINGELPIDFYDKLDALNNEQSINWLAIKAMYTGYETGEHSSWKDSELKHAVSQNWDENFDDVPLGIRDRGIASLTKIFTESGDTSWYRILGDPYKNYLFDPSKTPEENAKLNP